MNYLNYLELINFAIFITIDITERISKEISRTGRTNTQLGLLIFDIDNFKKINDEFGHYKGDFVLKTLTNEISKIIRTEDIFCRYGGDEFIILEFRSSKEKN